MDKIKIVKFLFSFIVLFLLLCGPHAWFTWYIPIQYTYLISTLVCIMYVITTNIHFQYSNKILIGYIYFFLANLLMYRDNIATVIFRFIGVGFPLYILINTNDDIFKFVQRGLAVLLFPSILLHIFFNITYFPNTFIIQHPNSESYIFYNYLFLLKRIFGEDWSIRFQAFFLEPGYLGTLCCFMLYADNFNLKKNENKVILTALILSLSLAGFITGIIGYIISIRKMKRIMLFAIILYITYLISINYNDGHNAINEEILYRLQYDAEKGISGNNRFSETTDIVYDKLNLKEFLFGLGRDVVLRLNTSTHNNDNITGCGYKLFFITYGILSFILVFFFYGFVGFSLGKHKKYYVLGFLFLVFITFIQASYPLSYSWLIPYTLGVKNIEHKLLL